MEKEIDLYLISGFLGSGKTTFLQKMLMNLEGLRVGVLVNEFGSIGIDGILIEQDGIQLVEINNGSIFCSCIKGDFIKTLIDFSTTEIDVLVIENSGMADPSNIHQIIDEVSEWSERPFQYRGAICIVDSVSFQKQVKVLTPVQNQIASSNFMVINKIDMVNQSDIEAIRRIILEINPKAFIYETIYSEVPYELLQERLSDNGYIGETSNKCYNRPTCYSLECDGVFQQQAVIPFVHKLQSFVLRMKGFVKGEDCWWRVDVVGEQIVIEEAKLGKRDILEKTKLVLIGHDTKDFKNEVDTAWKEAFQAVADIYE